MRPWAGLLALLLAPSAAAEAVRMPPDVDALLEAWESEAPQWVDRYELGASLEGRPIWAVRVTDESVPHDAPPTTAATKLRILLDGGHHGDEYLATELVLAYVGALLVAAQSGDGSVADALARVEIHAVPVVNPDGAVRGVRGNARGVDLNRNYPHGWGGVGSSDAPDSPFYRGTGAASEPETQAMVELVRALRPDLWVGAHAGAVSLLRPWSGSPEVPPDEIAFDAAGKAFRNATSALIPVVRLGAKDPAAGGADDWGYGAMGAASFVLEVHQDKNVTTYDDALGDLLALPLTGLDALVRNASRLGAWVEAEAVTGGLRLRNEGWGAAQRVEVRIGGAVVAAANVAPGAVVDVPLGTGIQGSRAYVAWEYPVRVVEASPVRVHAEELQWPRVVPAWEGPLVAVVAVALALVLRRT
jgi:hypothetical protein